VILFFGPPGSGKSVQGDLLVKRNNWQWLSTGQLFRDSKDPEVHKVLASGEFINDELTNKVLDDALKEIAGTTKVVLDGYTRNTDQAKWLVEHLPTHGREISCVVEFDVPKDELIRRQSERGRAEDTPEVIERRLDLYHQKTKPVLDYYRGLGVPVFTVNGDGTVEDVHEKVQQTVEACLRA
jgi:adenylate kinase